MFDLKNVLVFLYRNVSGILPNQGDRYEYNHDYLSPLAMTDIPNTLFPKLPKLPKNELPSQEWVLLLLNTLSVINLNNTSKTTNNDISFSLESSLESDSTFLSNKLDHLEAIGKQIRKQEKPEVLNDVAFNLASTLKEVDEHLKIDEKLGTFHNEVNEEFAELLNEPTGSVSFDLPSSEDSTTEKIKEIIRYNAKLLALNEDKNAEEFVDVNNINFSVTEKTSSLSLEDYDNLFQHITKPEISTKFQQDLVFAYMQVAGPNPVMLKQMKAEDSRLPITNEQYQKITSKITETADSFSVALQEGRLYIADYALLDGMVNGNFPDQQKYINAPVALFAVPPVNSSSRPLVPIAIYCQQALFTPLEEGTWMTAKNIVQMADSNYHELVSHLGRTHLFIEPFVVATNHLPQNHNLRKLLKPHLEGTVLINYGAHTSLVAPKGSVDKLLASDIRSDQNLSVKAAQSYLFNFNDVAFPKTLESRGVNDDSQLPIYPYRDDGKLIWDAIYNWVKAYLSSYYPTDSLVLNDQDLQKWSSELISQKGGRLKNFGEDAQGTIKTVDYLVEAISTIIFTASAQHAAVNFSQRGLMLYPPAFPLARYQEAPANPQESVNFMDGLPSLERAKDQINMLYLLGSVYYTKLSDYTKSYFEAAPPGVEVALTDFQNTLKDIEQKIRDRNQESNRLIAYEYLLPSKIPQSINI
ncbi:lipoxygenase family protein [Anabaena cylindrica UHCC 0172]|uniref:lipoxygenase family protein n=1 Tax=Anabaena cylindrica TaxID=1165 RepID=UPI002B1EF9CA|nr:lipoxygenase family protein [Anabaena cylindrica]MEA5551839.1 lipoxygenase family protein [Anabaena cylindrica UHCC 0172]